MNFWQKIELDIAVPLICDRSIDKIHEEIIKKHNQKLDFTEKTKLKNLIALRPPTLSQKRAIKSLVNGGNCDMSIDINYLKSCQDKPYTWQKTTKRVSNCDPLDTLALLRTKQPPPEKKDISDKKTISGLRKRAAAKYHTLQYLPGLIKLDSPLKNSYCNTLTCSESVISKNGMLHSAYCKNRWCQVCNRIKTANLINGYQPEIDQLQDKKFVTLSFANIAADELPKALRHHYIWWRSFYLKKMDDTKKIRRLLLIANKIGDNEAKGILSNEYRDLKLKGIRKVECTYNAIFDNYHPHQHILVDGKQNANEMLASWLSYCDKNGLKVDLAAQQIDDVGSNISKELFKYFTKIASSTGKKKNGKKEQKVFVHALDIMFLAMRGLQVFTAFGIDKIVDEDEIKPIYDDEGLDDVWMWQKNDWVNDKKEKLSGYKPSKYEIERKKFIVYDKKYEILNRMPEFRKEFEVLHMILKKERDKSIK